MKAYNQRFLDWLVTWYPVAYLVINIIIININPYPGYGAEIDLLYFYVHEAKALQQGHFVFDLFHGPVYPMLLALTEYWLGDFVLAAKYISAMSATGLLVITQRYIKSQFSSKVALWVLAFLFGNRIFWQFSYTGGTDMFAAMLAFLAIYLASRKRLVYVALAAICAGLVFLTRYVYLIIPVAFVVGWATHKLRRNKYIQGKAVVLYLLLFTMTVAPYGYLSFLEYGTPFKNKNYLNVAYEMVFSKHEGITFDYPFLMNADNNELLFHEVYVQQDLRDASYKLDGSGELLKKYPEQILKGGAFNLVENAAYHAVFVVGWPLVAALLAFCILNMMVLKTRVKFTTIKNWIVKHKLFCYPAMLYFIALLLVFYRHRFGLFLLPFYFAILVQVLLFLKKKAQSGILKSKAVWYALLLICLADASFFNWQHINRNQQLDKLGNFEPTKGAKVAALTPQLAYENDAKLLPFPYVNNADTLRKVIEKENISYIYYGTIEKAWRPDLNDVFKDSLPFWLEPVSEDKYAGLYRVVHVQKPNQ